MDIAARNERQRIRRKASGNLVTKRYEKTRKGFLMRLYRNIQSRTKGIQKAKFHLYEGKGMYLTRDEFYERYLTNETFNCLFNEWEQSEHDRKLTPSLDRVDSSKGYIFDNLEWVTHSENSRRGAINRNRSI
jgi:hypothetical protein